MSLIWCLFGTGEEQNPIEAGTFARYGSSVSAVGMAPSSPFGLLKLGIVISLSCGKVSSLAALAGEIRTHPDARAFPGLTIPLDAA